MPDVGSWSGDSELVLEGCVAGYGTLGDHWDAVHDLGSLLGLTSPV